MGGPALGLVTREPVAVADALARMAALGDWRAGEDEGDGWLDGRPLLIAHENAYWEDHDPASLRRLAARLGWVPCEHQLFVIAMANQAVDHAVLARVAAGLCGALDAAIDYGPTSVEPADLPGWSVSLEYEIEPGVVGSSSVVSAEWLRAWAAHPEFRLPK